MQQFAIIFLSILLEALPFVLIGTIISSLIEIFVTQEWLANHLPKKSLIAYLVAGLAGVIFPVCECAIVPIMRRLVKKGMPIGVAVTFMLATPTINPIVLLSTYYAFPTNLNFSFFRGLFGYLTAISVGTIISFLSHKDELKEKLEPHKEGCSCGHSHGKEEIEDGTCGKGHHDEDSCACGCHHEIHEHSHDCDDEEVCSCGHSHATKKSSPKEILLSILSHTSNELYEVGRFLILGITISSALQTFVPKQYFLALSQNPTISILAMMALAFVLSLCSEADAFIGASFQGSLSNSSILAFLIFGPMMDIKNMLMLSGGFKARFILRLILAISVVVFIFSSISAFFF